MTESAYRDVMSEVSELTNQELDEKLEQAAIQSEKAEMLLCCYLSAVNTRRAFEAFGYQSLYDYTEARFGFGPRKTRYLVSLGRKLDCLPKLREALASGKIGWCKASRIAPVAHPDNESMWLESALSLTVQQLEKRIKDGTDTLISVLSFALTEDRRILWENALEIMRRRAGAEISPVEAFELMVAEVIAAWAHLTVDELEDETPLVEEAMPEDELAAPETTPEDGDGEADVPRGDSLFPFAEAVDTGRVVPPNVLEGRAPHAHEWSPPKLMQAVLERRRNRPSIWLDDLEIREWTIESPAAPETAPVSP